MKKSILALSVMVLSQSGFGMYHGALLSKTTTPGFTLPEYRVFTTCEVHPDKLVKRVKIASTELVTTAKLELKGDLFKLIHAAYQAELNGEVEKVQGPTDVPTTSYVAVQIMPNDSIHRVNLKTDGQVKVTNKSVAAKSLVQLIENTCR